jgi:hypothetical protein
MGEYADIKRKKMKRLLKWLGNKKYMTVREGGNHQYVVECSFWARPFPIPFKHNEVNKHIVKELVERLMKEGICTKEEFDNYI